ncbi:hypothetical protein JXD38_04755 [candidate division WOR-3 bacterium]|nr:hypothetical protein [candidate division WOR-3 bacterium]
MEQLRKAGTWVWYAKERLVLGALVVFLCVRVYDVVNPEAIEGPPVQPPRGMYPEDNPPPEPPPMPAPLSQPDTGALVSRNPFTVYSSPAAAQQSSNAAPEELGIRLVRIVPWREGEYRAELITQNRNRGRYSEGELFENYRLERIDPDNQSVDIWSDQYNRMYTLHMQ